MSQHKSLYNTARWKARRKHQLSEDPLCKYCLDLGKTKPAKIADHITPHRGDYDLFYEGRLQSLCWTCHSSAKQVQELTGKLIGGNDRGQPIDPGHHWNK